MNINDLVRFWGRTRPEHPAIIFDGKTQTWGELDAVSDALARGLAERGVRKGDRVGILMKNRPEVAWTMLATVKLGAISVPLNFRLLGKELQPMLEDAAPKVVVAEAELTGLLEPAHEVLDFGIFATGDSDLPSFEQLLVHSGPSPAVELADEDPAFICYTSGTTGVQKGALLTHRSILSVGQSAAVAHGLTWRDRVLAAAPLVYTGSGISVFMQFVVYPGATMVLLRDFDAELGLAAIIDHKVTASTMVPVIWERMARLPGFNEKHLANFTFAGAGGAPVRTDLLETFRAQGIPLTQVYGITEASGLVAAMRYEDAVKRPGFAGLPLLGTQIRIGDERGETLPAGEVGEVMVYGPHVMNSYWQRPEETAAAIQQGWLRTGDLGLQDEDGFLKLVDRSKDLVISGGLNVYPAEIEQALSGIEGVLELAVIGVPDANWGEVPMVVFRTEQDVPTVRDRLAAAAESNLARFKQPKYAVGSADPLPRTFSGKLAKPLLRQQFPNAPEDSALPRSR
ncbi:long-chain fatty acid--CoA ligase [Amycolatopsis acidicola]|uniref:Long-chain fatty acid--CoA ligase n=1 Tax=Amycolatopsis acidicola TaxID=2596893 RepID=A0A5N0UYS5_9PSEU|nr:AMP-binding protein [Amycolatopsis acidicola]KAA9156787.1 long-chain fatty acid--CoA ligase [Amycolatopsis acidicola]